MSQNTVWEIEDNSGELAKTSPVSALPQVPSQSMGGMKASLAGCLCGLSSAFSDVQNNQRPHALGLCSCPAGRRCWEGNETGNRDGLKLALSLWNQGICELDVILISYLWKARQPAEQGTDEAPISLLALLQIGSRVKGMALSINPSRNQHFMRDQQQCANKSKYPRNAS